MTTTTIEADVSHLEPEMRRLLLKYWLEENPRAAEWLDKNIVGETPVEQADRLCSWLEVKQSILQKLRRYSSSLMCTRKDTSGQNPD